jgi:MFS family permease
MSRLAEIGRELWHLVRSRDGLLVVLLSIAPIGVSGADNFFSGIASEWKVPAGTVAVVTGFAGGLVAMGGCLLAGWWADRADRRVVYLATGLLVASATIALALAPHTPSVFVVGTLAQRVFIGMGDAALSALALSVIGRSAAATKFAVLGALGNAPEIYMTLISGRVHDTWSTETMLLVESAIAIMCLAAAALWLRRSRGNSVVEDRFAVW